MTSNGEEMELNAKDKAVIAFQGTLKAIPYFGSSLEHFIFGPLTELRMRRIEQTLSEIATAVGELKANAISNERFATLLESVAPELCRAVDENKRKRFRDLLINAAALPEDSGDWEEAALASTLLKEIDAPGLAILAAIARCSEGEALVLTSSPVSQVFEGSFDYDDPGEPQHVLQYKWVIVEYWARKLRESNLITYNAYDARGGFGGVALAPLGKFLIQWTVRA